jgi:glutathione S-transferase
MIKFVADVPPTDLSVNMIDHPKIVLRYFNARGRAQFLRYYLLVRNIDFDDRRIGIDNDFADWAAIREDRSLTGPFMKLPVLHWGDRLIAETLVIGAFLHDSFGDKAMLSDDDALRHQMLASTLYTDLMLQLGILLWGTLLYEGIDDESFIRRSYDRIHAQLVALDTTLTEWAWIDAMQARPIMIADCLLWEEIDVVRTVFGTHVDFSSLPTLDAVYERYSTGTAFRRLLQDNPCQITARPGEAQMIAQIQQTLSDMTD